MRSMRKRQDTFKRCCPLTWDEELVHWKVRFAFIAGSFLHYSVFAQRTPWSKEDTNVILSPHHIPSALPEQYKLARKQRREAQSVPSAIFLKVNSLWQCIVWASFQMSVQPLCQLLCGELSSDTLPQVYCINKQSLFEQDQWQQNCLLVSKKTLIMCTKGEGPWFDRPSLQPPPWSINIKKNNVLIAGRRLLEMHP